MNVSVVNCLSLWQWDLVGDFNLVLFSFSFTFCEQRLNSLSYLTVYHDKCFCCCCCCSIHVVFSFCSYNWPFMFYSHHSLIWRDTFCNHYTMIFFLFVSQTYTATREKIKFSQIECIVQTNGDTQNTHCPVHDCTLQIYFILFHFMIYVLRRECSNFTDCEKIKRKTTTNN